MKRPIRLLSVAFVSFAGLALFAAGCGDDSAETTTGTNTTATGTGGSPSTTGTGGAPGTGGGTTATTGTGGAGTGGTGGQGGAGGEGPPPPPELGAQIERMGRPAISTALNHSFSEEGKPRAKDAYNAATPEDWQIFTEDMANNLGIIDAIDGLCGNQLLSGPDPTADRYDVLASVLADDRLWVNVGSNTCTSYLAVEADATGLLPNNDCGGRRLTDDVIETSYSALAAGLLSGIDDTIEKVASKTDGTDFPYLAAPLE